MIWMLLEPTDSFEALRTRLVLGPFAPNAAQALSIKRTNDMAKDRYAGADLLNFTKAIAPIQLSRKIRRSLKGLSASLNEQAAVHVGLAKS